MEDNNIRQCIFYDKDNQAKFGGILLENGNIICGECGGLIESDDIGPDPDCPFELIAVLDSWFDLSATIKNASASLLAADLVAFYKDYDPYGYWDSLEIGETDEDAIREMENSLLSPESVRLIKKALEKILEEDDDELAVHKTVNALIKRLPKPDVDKNERTEECLN